MSKPVKDFEYYAEKAEELLVGAVNAELLAQFKWRIEAAELYTRLAAAAPKAEPEPEPEPKSNFFYFVNGQRVEGERCFTQRFANPLVDPARSQCVRSRDHDGQHKTANGEYFDAE